MANNPFRSYFGQFFLTLPISRTGFADLGRKAHDGVKAADLGSKFTAPLGRLNTALDGFDVNLTDRNTSRADDTEAQRLVRAAIVTFVDDTLIDFVNPKLRRLPALKQFKGLKKSAFRRLEHKDVNTQLGVFAGLLRTHAGALGTTDPADQADTLLKQWEKATRERTEGEQEVDDTILELAADWVAVARALREIQLLLLLDFLNDADGGEARAYSFFDFGKTFQSKYKPRKRNPEANPNA